MNLDRSKCCVYLLDDDPCVQRSLTRLLNACGFRVDACTCASEFLHRLSSIDFSRSSIPACLLLDVSLPDVDGPQIQRRIDVHGGLIPVIFLSGTASVAIAAQAMRAGALHFLSKPVDSQTLIGAVDEGLCVSAQRIARHAAERESRAQLRTLTEREVEVLLLVTRGLLNKQIAGQLGTVEKTIKVHRARLMRKLQARSVPDLVRFVDSLGLNGAEKINVNRATSSSQSRAAEFPLDLRPHPSV
jgi:FixJ family two-component response regulator